MAYYDKISSAYDELYGDEQAGKVNAIKSGLKIEKNSRLLDVGCGTGISSDFQCFAVGLDPSIGLLRKNKNRMKVMGAAETLPFKDGSFDYVISVTSMHNFYNLDNSLKEISRVGKNYFVFSVLKKSGSFQEIKTAIEKNFKVCNIAEEDKDAIFFCRKAEICLKLGRNKFLELIKKQALKKHHSLR